jgi:hypothetical protein
VARLLGFDWLRWCLVSKSEFWTVESTFRFVHHNKNLLQVLFIYLFIYLFICGVYQVRIALRYLFVLCSLGVMGLEACFHLRQWRTWRSWKLKLFPFSHQAVHGHFYFKIHPLINAVLIYLMMSWELILLFLDSMCIYTFDENSMHTRKRNTY